MKVISNWAKDDYVLNEGDGNELFTSGNFAEMSIVVG